MYGQRLFIVVLQELQCYGIVYMLVSLVSITSPCFVALYLDGSMSCPRLFAVVLQEVHCLLRCLLYCLFMFIPSFVLIGHCVSEFIWWLLLLLLFCFSFNSRISIIRLS